MNNDLVVAAIDCSTYLSFPRDCTIKSAAERYKCCEKELKRAVKLIRGSGIEKNVQSVQMLLNADAALTAVSFNNTAAIKSIKSL